MDLFLVEVTVGALHIRVLVVVGMTPMIVAAAKAKSLRTWLAVLATVFVLAAHVGPAIKASVPMPTPLAANEALELIDGRSLLLPSL